MLIACAALYSCGNVIPQNHSLVVTDSSSAQDIEDSSEEQTESVHISESTITPNVAKYVKYSKTYQAETGELTGNAAVSKKRGGYKGKGYVTGLKTEEDGWVLTFELTDSQYYNITVTAASDSATKNALTVNGDSVGDFSLTGSGKFENATFENIYLEKGYIKISIPAGADVIDIDQVTVTASKEIENFSPSLENAALINENADSGAKALYRYICENYGKYTLLGQHDSVGTVTETEKIFELTGKYPAIRLGDLMPFTEDMIIGEHEIEYAENWAEKGGIVSYMWHWTDPAGSGEYYADSTDFDLSKAVTKQKIARLSLDEIKQLEKEKKVSHECVLIVEDIDKISQKLAQLRDDGIPVLWRPLQEASNGYFWWGRDIDSYKWLWKLLYERQTYYHELNNLIWVWSAQNAAWYVGDDYCDILSVDIYDQGNLSGQINRQLFLDKICKNKPAAISECGNFPSIQSMADQKAMWSFIGQWGGNFLLNEDGGLNTEYNSEENLLLMYNNDLTVTLDKLPDLKALAAQIEEEESAADEKEKDSSAADKDGGSSAAGADSSKESSDVSSSDTDDNSSSR